MKIQIELSSESPAIVRHFKKGTDVHDILRCAAHKDFAGIEIYFFECEPPQAEVLLEMARDHCPPAVKDIEHAIFAVTAGLTALYG